MVGCISGSTFEGLATTLFGHSASVLELVWSLQTKGDGLKIGWEEFIAFAEKEDHIPVRCIFTCQNIVWYGNKRAFAVHCGRLGTRYGDA